MKELYYTPDIEEFHVGFEFEMDDTWGGWKKLILTEKLLKSPSVGLGSGNERAPYYWKTRVKYLDEKDIESFGFDCVSNRGMAENYGGLFVVASNVFKQMDIELRCWYTNHRVNISHNRTIFDGTIKNKSELKKLLTQLNII